MKKNEKGASLIEYALLVAMISLAATIAMRDVSAKVSQQFSSFGEAMCGHGSQDGCNTPGNQAD